MSSQDDLNLRGPEEPGRIQPDESKSRLPVIIAALVVVIAAVAYFFFRSPGPEAPATSPEASTAQPVSEPGRGPLGGQPEPVDVPPLGESDPVVRTLVQSLSSHPRVAAWLATDGLIRNFTVVVDNIANGKTPARHLQVLKPTGRFATTGRNADLRIDPASYSRYDELAAAVSSIDPEGAARIYATLKPRIEEAHRELGDAKPFDETLEAAIVRLVQTPIPQDEPLQAKGAEAFQYTNARFESLSSAQKLLLRMGPTNARLVQDKLRQIGLALGIPASRLGA